MRIDSAINLANHENNIQNRRKMFLEKNITLDKKVINNKCVIDELNSLQGNLVGCDFE